MVYPAQNASGNADATNPEYETKEGDLRAS